MQTVVTILNVIASLASLAMVWFGWVMAGFAAEFNPQHRDYYGIAYSVVVMATFLIVPVLCVMASRKLVRQHRRGSVLVALVPPAFLMYTAGGLRMLEHALNGLLGYS
jgi:hypothetical protein